jgi:phosphopantetheinyl transferase (holo-ACP synthase)
MVGIDTVPLARVESMYGRSYWLAFLAGLLSPIERASISGLSGRTLVREIAAAFAIKEAVIKASDDCLDLGDLHRITIVPCERGVISKATRATCEAHTFVVSVCFSRGDAIAFAAMRA